MTKTNPNQQPIPTTHTNNPYKQPIYQQPIQTQPIPRHISPNLKYQVNKSYMDANPILAEVWEAVDGWKPLDWGDERYAPYKNLTYHDVYRY